MTWPTFALAPSDADGLVIRRRKVFEAGDFPDKDFSLSPEEALAAAATFSPVDLDLQHVPSVLDGKLGKLLSLIPVDGGRELWGDVGIPQWLDQVLQNTPVELSAAWDRATKRLMRLALVVRARIPDAVLMSAFAQFEGRRNSGSDQQTIQQIHDLTTGLGAMCSGQAMFEGAGPLAMWAAFTVGGSA